MKSGEITQAIVDYVKAHPGTTSQEIFEALPKGTKLGTIQNTLSRLERLGVLQNRGGRVNRFTPALWYTNDPFIGKRAQELARNIYSEMVELHGSVREQFLAEKLDELLAEKRKK